LRYEQGHVDEALSLISEAFASRRRELGALAPPTLNSLNKLGVIHRAKADYANAVACGQQALDGRRQVLGVAHIDTLRTLNDLGSALYDRGLYEADSMQARRQDWNGASTLYKEAVDRCRATVGGHHPLTLQSMNNYGNLLHVRGLAQPKFIPGRGPNKRREEQMRAGAELLRQSLDASRTVHGSGHLETLISTSNLGSALRSLGGESCDGAMSEEASGLIRQAVEGIADAWGEHVERRPQWQAALRPGLEDLLQEGPAMNDEPAQSGLAARKSADQNGGSHPSHLSTGAGVATAATAATAATVAASGKSSGFDASGAFLRGLLSVDKA